MLFSANLGSLLPCEGFPCLDLPIRHLPGGDIDDHLRQLGGVAARINPHLAARL